MVSDVPQAMPLTINVEAGSVLRNELLILSMSHLDS